MTKFKNCYFSKGLINVDTLKMSISLVTITKKKFTINKTGYKITYSNDFVNFFINVESTLHKH